MRVDICEDIAVLNFIIFLPSTHPFQNSTLLSRGYPSIFLIVHVFCTHILIWHIFAFPPPSTCTSHTCSNTFFLSPYTYTHTQSLLFSSLPQTSG